MKTSNLCAIYWRKYFWLAKWSVLESNTEVIYCGNVCVCTLFLCHCVFWIYFRINFSLEQQLVKYFHVEWYVSGLVSCGMLSYRSWAASYWEFISSRWKSPVLWRLWGNAFSLFYMKCFCVYTAERDKKNQENINILLQYV